MRCGGLRALLVGAAAPVVAQAASLRQALIDAAEQRLDVWYRDESNLEGPKQRDGVVFRLSKEDKACGGNGVPLSFMEFDVENARPVDVFNTLVDVQHQTTWDVTNTKTHFLGDMQLLQARGWAAIFHVNGLPVADREVFEWQFAKANVSTQEFWVVFSSLENDELLQKQPPDPGSTQMQNCLGAYKIMPGAKGTHVVMTQQVNTHPWPLDARSVVATSWGKSVDWVNAFRAESMKQAALGWNSSNVTLPRWMLEDRPCGAVPADVELKNSMLIHARAALANTEGAESTKQLPGGETLHIWRRSEACGGCGVSSDAVPVWRAEFQVTGAEPEDVFNALVAKGAEHEWNSRLLRANVSGFHSGARGVHEEFESPKTPLHTWAPRELWEWQVANHTAANRSYLVALSSATEPTSERFSSDTTTAVQCMAAYEILPAGANATIVRLSQHLNPNLGILSSLKFLWIAAGEKLLADFAVGLSGRAARLRSSRERAAGEGGVVGVDGGALALLAPPPPERNASATVASALSSPNRKALLETFAAMDLPAALNTEGRGPSDFAKLAADVASLFSGALHDVATEEERAAFRFGAAADEVLLQLQGEALATLQSRVLQNVTQDMCNSDLPDINNNKKAGGLPLMLLVGVGVSAVALLVACVTCCCCRCWRKRRAARALAAEALLQTAEATCQRCETA